jgi:O-antigen/teichoic acid export membrane protein
VSASVGSTEVSDAVASRGVGRNVALSLIQQGTTGLFTAGLTIYLVRALGPTRFGTFTLALGIGGLVQLVSEFGLPQSVARFVAERSDDKSAVATLLADGLRLQLLISGAIATALYTASEPIAHAYGEPHLLWPLRGVALAVFGQSVMSLHLNTLTAVSRIDLNVRVVFVESLTETAATVGLVLLGGGVVGAAMGRAIGYAVGGAIAIVAFLRLYGRPSIRSVSPFGGSARPILAYAAPLLVTNGAYTLYGQADILIIGAMLGVASVGVFGAALRMTFPLSYLGQAVGNSVAPRQVSLGGKDGDHAALRTGLRWLVVVQAMLLAPLVVWAEPIVRLLLGPGFSGSADVLRLLAPYIFLLAVSPPITMTVNYLGRARGRIPIVVAALLINVVIDISLIPVIGVKAGAIGTTVAYCVYVPAHLRLLPRNLLAVLRPLLVTVVRALMAATVMAAVLYAVGTNQLSAAQWLVGVTGGSLAFFAMLLLNGEFSPGELRAGARAAAAAASRLR